ncbi:hypothetical protein ACFLZH_05510 [Patescibacteria group bacterium]
MKTQKQYPENPERSSSIPTESIDLKVFDKASFREVLSKYLIAYGMDDILKTLESRARLDEPELLNSGRFVLADLNTAFELGVQAEDADLGRGMDSRISLLFSAEKQKFGRPAMVLEVDQIEAAAKIFAKLGFNMIAVPRWRDGKIPSKKEAERIENQFLDRIVFAIHLQRKEEQQDNIDVAEIRKKTLHRAKHTLEIKDLKVEPAEPTEDPVTVIKKQMLAGTYESVPGLHGAIQEELEESITNTLEDVLTNPDPLLGYGLGLITADKKIEEGLEDGRTISNKILRLMREAIKKRAAKEISTNLAEELSPILEKGGFRKTNIGIAQLIYALAVKYEVNIDQELSKEELETLNGAV